GAEPGSPWALRAVAGAVDAAAMLALRDRSFGRRGLTEVPLHDVRLGRIRLNGLLGPLYGTGGTSALRLVLLQQAVGHLRHQVQGAVPVSVLLTEGQEATVDLVRVVAPDHHPR